MRLTLTLFFLLIFCKNYYIIFIRNKKEGIFMRGHSLYQVIPKEPQLVLRITVLDNDIRPLESEECTVYDIDKLEE
ncbi:MAG: hypothetical protein IIU59_00270, partial [Alistipes sp.]|nr:hypothetical protein [Alistipes sp.]